MDSNLQQIQYKPTDVILNYKYKQTNTKRFMVEHQQPQALPASENISAQMEFMSLCDCKSGNKIAYHCDQEDCPSFTIEKLYCTECMTKHNHLPINIHIQNTSDDWNVLHQDAKTLLDNLECFTQLHGPLLDTLDSYQTNNVELRFRTKLDSSKLLYAEIDRFYKENGDGLTLGNEYRGFKERIEELRFFVKIGPGALWRLYSGIIQMVSTHQILESFASHSCEVFLFLKCYFLYVTLNEKVFQTPVGELPQQILDCQNLLNLSGIISNYIDEAKMQQELNNSQNSYIDFLRSELESIKVSMMYLRVKDDQNIQSKKIRELEERLSQVTEAKLQGIAQPNLEEAKQQLIAQYEAKFDQLALSVRIFKSVILNDGAKQRKIIDFFEQAGTPLKQSNLLYRGSVSKFGIAEFHKQCDHKPKTITIIRTTKGNIIGGYTSQLWNHFASFKVDKTAWLFNIDLPNIFRVQPSGEKAIVGNSNYGPIFGGGHNLSIVNAANNNSGSGVSINSSYENLENVNLLKGQDTTHFRVTEIEVFQI
ncbi:hypothetical protein FGO68_gene7835 [Halteria grandinella]|uniref:TLDc domain-containing protein n=1 Tax=Halteria grandinella TaxID=5974 RepID=A0A8J8NSL7_HALGN|nr:hypothetical protein FGO68_gene7835 [Halteria grandinella]